MRGLTQDYIKELESSGDLAKLQALLTEDEKKEFFLGLRKNALCLYYKGMLMAEIKNETEENVFQYKMDKYYKQGIVGYEKKETMPSEVFWNKANIEIVKSQIRKHVFGYHEPHCVLHLERVCQQWIMNQNNWSEDSDWYYIDMEYVYDPSPIDEEGDNRHPYGRADMIAIKKTSNKKNANGKNVHDVAFVELKVGTEAYGENFTVRAKTQEERDRKNKEQKALRMIMKEEGVYDERLDQMKLGSGIVSHIADFLRLFAHLDWYQDKIREELINMLDVHKKMGLIEKDSPLAKIDNINMLASKPDYYVVSYGKAPSVSLNEINQRKHDRFVDKKVKEMKCSFFNYLYTSKNCATTLFKGQDKTGSSDDIEGIRALKDEFALFCETDDAQIECIQQIKGEPFRMVFRFVDGKNKNDALRCLD